MRKFVYLLLFLLSVGSMDAFAQRQLVVELKDGSTDSYVLSDEPEVTFRDTFVCVQSEKAWAEYERGQVARFYFEAVPETPDGIDALKGGLRIEYVSNDRIVVYGTSDARLYDLAGRRLAPKITAADDVVTIGLENIPGGVYVVVLPNHPSVKIQKQ